MEIKEQANLIAKTIFDKKAKDILIIDVEEQTSIASYFIMATVTSNTQAKGVMSYVEDELSKLSIEPIRKDIKNNSNWTILDYGDIIVHIMESETREFYNLEKLWVTNKNTVKYEG